jgi:phospholipid N-methyltransferase
MLFERDERVTFIKGFLQSPQQVGSVIPSSRFLERRVVELAETRRAATVIELGSGTGGTTRAILQSMGAYANLVSIEINPMFREFIQRIDDPRLISHLGNAANLREIMDQYQLTSADAVISGIPFSTIHPTIATQILNAIYSVLTPGGRFVAYQVRRRVETLCRPIFGPARVAVELFNIPPVWVYRWEKPVEELRQAQ